MSQWIFDCGSVFYSENYKYEISTISSNMSWERMINSKETTTCHGSQP